MEPANATSLERPLRLFTILTAAIALPLNIVATVLSLEHQYGYWGGRRVTSFCFGFIPLAMTVATCLISLRYIKKHSKSPRAWHFKALDLLSALAYFSVLVPCWALELREYNDAGFGLLTGYVTAPMVLNMFIHGYFTLSHITWKQYFSKVFSCRRSSACQQCPKCQAKFIPETQTTMKKGYSLLRGEEYLDVEADPILYRDSEDFLGEGADRAERAEQSEQPEQAKAAEDSSKGKDRMEV